MRKILEIYNEDFKQSNIAISGNHFTVYGFHSHNFYEIEYIAEGSAEYNINGNTITIFKGDMVLVSPMDLHSYKSLTGELVKTITVHFNPDNLDGLNIMKSAVIHCDKQTRDMIYLLKDEYAKPDKYTPKALKNILSYILVSFLRHKEIERESAMPEGVSYVAGYINRNFREEINLDILCGKTGYTKSYICRLFKRHMGIGIVEYLNNARLSYAEKLLTVHDLSVLQVSLECGFGSVRHFNRLFAARYGCTPKKFKMDSIVTK